MNDVPNSEGSLFLSHYVVIQIAVEFPLSRVSESSLGENNLVVLVYLQSICLTELSCERLVQGQELCQSVKRKATAAAVVSVAVY